MGPTPVLLTQQPQGGGNRRFLHRNPNPGHLPQGPDFSPRWEVEPLIPASGFPVRHWGWGWIRGSGLSLGVCPGVSPHPLPQTSLSSALLSAAPQCLQDKVLRASWLGFLLAHPVPPAATRGTSQSSGARPASASGSHPHASSPASFLLWPLPVDAASSRGSPGLGLATPRRQCLVSWCPGRVAGWGLGPPSMMWLWKGAPKPSGPGPAFWGASWGASWWGVGAGTHRAFARAPWTGHLPPPRLRPPVQRVCAGGGGGRAPIGCPRAPGRGGGWYGLGPGPSFHSVRWGDRPPPGLGAVSAP